MNHRPQPVKDNKICRCGHTNYGHDLLGIGASGRCQDQRASGAQCGCANYICNNCGEYFTKTQC
mgnify:CR=1 FL=1